MPDTTLWTLLTTAVVIGLTHTLAGPDHYVPFIAMARVGGWSRRKTMLVTFWCGLAHVGSSVAIGLVGIALGVAVGRLEWLESFRGGLAGWLLLGFGLAYTIWGIRQAVRNRPHAHIHAHGDGTVHRHVHTHHDEHVHVHDHARAGAGGDPPPEIDALPHGHCREHASTVARAPESCLGTTEARRGKMTPWVLFTIFIFGPCEPLIPLLMIPAAGLHWGAVALVTLVFSAATIAVMLGMVLAGVAGLSLLPMERMERYTHALAGGALLACGLALQLGL